MSCTIFSAQLTGLEAELIRVEVDITPGLHLFSLVGLADKEVQESRERIAAAIKNIGALAPHKRPQRVIVNLAPADLKKEGPSFDLPIALGYLLASDQAKFDPSGKVFVGELGLDGGVRPVRGALATADMAARLGFRELFVPVGNGPEAAFVSGISVFEVSTLKECLDHLEGRNPLSPVTHVWNEEVSAAPYDFSEIRGQEAAKRALEIAAAGGHNALMHGPPGTGKTMLARALPSILPPLTQPETIEVIKIYSASGISRNPETGSARPFRAPHHTASAVAVVGGGSAPRPGEITLAHRGVLFLDEFPEFQRPVLEALREPLEERAITVSRMQGTTRFPADFILVAAMNPCPCGNLGNQQLMCSCSPGAIQKYQRKVSGPLIDRIDLHVQVPNLPYRTLESSEEAESSQAIRARVETARKIQSDRFREAGVLKNSEMGVREVKRFARPDAGGQAVLEKAVEKYALSARSYHRTLKLARTIADLSGEEGVGAPHVLEALKYRPQREL